MRDVMAAGRSNRAFMRRALNTYHARHAHGEPADRSILAHLVRMIPLGWRATQAMIYRPVQACKPRCDTTCLDDQLPHGAPGEGAVRVR
jgi:hypothetical protein